MVRMEVGMKEMRQCEMMVFRKLGIEVGDCRWMNNGRLGIGDDDIGEGGVGDWEKLVEVWTGS